MVKWIRYCLATLAISVLTFFVHSAAAAELSVVPNGQLGPFRHGTYPSLGDRTHVGVDIVAPCGTPIYPLAHGKAVDLISSSDDRDWKSLGYMVVIEHPASLIGKPFYTIYLHLHDAPHVFVVGREVTRDHAIGRVGNTGNTGGTCHVHFEVRYFKERYHPSWGNIYGPGDQRNSPVFKTGWEDPVPFLARDVFQRPKSPTPTSEADLQTGGRATIESLQDLQRKRIEERGGAERRFETRKDAQERVRSWFMSVGNGVVARFMSRSGLQFEEIDDRQFANYRLVLAASRETTARDWGRCGTGRARILVVGDNPFATKCNGYFFVPKEGEPVYVFMTASADEAARMCHATITSSRFISQGVWDKNEALTYAFPCGENVFESKRADIERLVEQATRSALSKK